MSDTLVTRVERAIDHHRLLERGDRIIVGVSGGMDSMVLLFLLDAIRDTYDLDLIVAHVNHGLRREESEREADLVRRESEKLGLPFEFGQFDVKAFQQSRGLSSQDAARRVRFHFFNDLSRKHGTKKIALGHHADDQVETILLRLMRGSGLKGLRGMHPFRDGRVIRPLLETWRKEIESFARDHHIPYLVDSSNLKKDYLRNKIRLDLIPLIEREYQLNFKRVVLKTSTLLREEDEYLDRRVEEACRKIISEERPLSFLCSEFQSLPKAIQRRLVQKLLERLTRDEIMTGEDEWFDVDSIHQKLTCPSASFYLELPFGLFLEKRYDRVSLGRGRRPPTPPFEVELVVPGTTHVQEVAKKVTIEEVSRGDPYKSIECSPDTALLDYQRVEFPLKVRNFRSGDRFRPLGVGGSQKVKEFFIDQKIPQFERLKIPLLISGRDIAWIVGYRIDERFKITEKTEKVLRIDVKQIEQTEQGV